MVEKEAEVMKQKIIVMERPRLSFQEHMETADDLAIAAHYIYRAYYRCMSKMPKKNRILGILWKFLPFTPDNLFFKLIILLDQDLCRCLSADDFKHYGGSYCRLGARFDQLKADGLFYDRRESGQHE